MYLESKVLQSRLDSGLAFLLCVLTYLLLISTSPLQNIMLSVDGHVALTDFGLSKELQPGETTASLIGTPDYIAPELIDGKGYGASTLEDYNHCYNGCYKGWALHTITTLLQPATTPLQP